MKIRVRAVGASLFPLHGYPGRFVGRAHDRSIIEEGVEVDDTSYHRRGIARGELQLVEEVTS